MAQARRPARGAAKPRARGVRASAPPTGQAWASASVGLAVVSTVAFWPDAQSRWVFPKLVVLALAVTVGAVAVRGGRLPRWLVFALLLGAATLAVSVLVAPSPWPQAWGRWPRYEGLVALPVYAGALWVGARTLGPRYRATTLPTALRWASFAALALGAVSILEALGIRPIPSDHARPGSLTGTATDQGILGATLAVVLATTVFRLARRRARDGRALISYSAFVFAVATVVVSASRVGLLALAAGLIVAAATPFLRPSPDAVDRRDSLRFGAVATATILALTAVAAFAVPLTRQRIVGGSGVDAAGLSDRPLIWKQALDVARHRLVLGWGPSGFEDAVPSALRPEWYGAVGKGAVLDSPHSGYLQVLLAGGVPLAIVALVVGVGGVIVVVRRIRAVGGTTPGADPSRDLASTALAVLAVLAVGLVTSFTSAAIVAIPALLVGGALSAPAGPDGTEPRRDRSVRRSTAAAMVVWLGFLVVSASAEAPLARAEAAGAAGDLNGTLAALREARSLRPWDADVKLIGAEILAAEADRGVNGAASEAIAWGNEALARLPGSVEGSMALAVAETAKGAAGDAPALAKAEAVLRDLRARVPFDPVVSHRLGGVLILEGRLGEARDELVAAAALAPNDRDILLTLEYAYTSLGDDAMARAIQARIAALPESGSA